MRKKLEILIVFGLVFSSFVLAQKLPLSEGQVYVCPLAKKLKEVNPWCDCRIDLEVGKRQITNCPLNGKTYEMVLEIEEYEGKEYYLILGFESGGAGINFSPQAESGGPYEAFVGEKIIFDASHSFDENKDPLKFRWDFEGDGVWDTDWLDNPKIEVSFDKEFEGNLKLEVSDGMLTNINESFLRVLKRKIFQPGGEIICECESWKEWKNKGCGEGNCEKEEMLQQRERICFPQNCKKQFQTRCLKHLNCLSKEREISQKVIKEKEGKLVKEKEGEEMKTSELTFPEKKEAQKEFLFSEKAKEKSFYQELLATLETQLSNLSENLILIISLFSFLIILFYFLRKKLLKRK